MEEITTKKLFDANGNTFDIKNDLISILVEYPIVLGIINLIGIVIGIYGQITVILINSILISKVIRESKFRTKARILLMIYLDIWMVLPYSIWLHDSIMIIVFLLVSMLVIDTSILKSVSPEGILLGYSYHNHLAPYPENLWKRKRQGKILSLRTSHAKNKTSNNQSKSAFYANQILKSKNISKNKLSFPLLKNISAVYSITKERSGESVKQKIISVDNTN
ncbi:MAG: hypothetical protein INQ03_16880 [Candidatus Heimdallarchaeota archaeon]|nr:hypothetical protein [Candidatus Heimdallarchaeota archaeon]